MKVIIERIATDWQQLLNAVASSQKKPFFVLEEIFYLFASLILLLFLTSLGRKVFKRFGLKVGIVEDLLFSLGLGIIFWGTLVLVLGMLGLFYFWVIWGVFGILFFICKKEMIGIIRETGVIGRIRRISDWGIEKKIFLVLIVLNIIGALSPEKGVDAIGYHLYFPKVYLDNHTMMLTARGSRLFSLFPHLASMIYLLPVSLNMPNVAQLIHMWLGVLTTVTISMATKSMTSSLIFYSAIIIGSISRSAYADFFITFFLSLGILLEVGVYRRDRGNRRNKGKVGTRILLSGLMFGGALATKNQSLALIPIIFGVWFFSGKKNLNSFAMLLLFSFSVPLLWYVRSIIISGNPFYPLFSLKIARVPEFNLNYYLNFEFVKYLKVLFLFQPIFILLILFIFKFFNLKDLRKNFFLGIFIFLYWIFLPDSFHDNRYFLPYFLLIIFLWSPVITKFIQLKLINLGILWLVGILVTIRLYTNIQYLPYVFGLEEKKVFLSNALRERPEDFYDIDGQFSKIITGEKGKLGEKGEVKVLVDNVLGLFYVDFPFAEFEYSSYYGRTMTISEFKDEWKKNDYSFLLLKNEKLIDFFAKMGIDSDGDNIFQLTKSHKLSKTYLYKPKF